MSRPLLNSNDAPDKPIAGFGDVARRMTSRTTDLIAIGIVVVASLTLGRQVLIWWHSAPSEGQIGANAASGPAWDNSGQPVSFEFGDLAMSMTREIVAGAHEAAAAALVSRCEKGARRARRPWRDRDAAEDQLLARVEGLTPVAEEAGLWRVYAFNDAFPAAAAVREFSAGPDNPAGHGPRLVCWCLAMPAGKESWNVYAFEGATATGPAPIDRLDIPLPPGARRSLAVRDERGAAITGFSGSSAPASWIKFYDDWFAGRGWSSNEGWLLGKSAWSARFHEPARSGGASVEVQFADEGSGQLSGLWQVIPPEPEQ